MNVKLGNNDVAIPGKMLSEMAGLFRGAPHLMCGAIILAAILGAAIAYWHNELTIRKLDTRIMELKAQQYQLRTK